MLRSTPFGMNIFNFRAFTIPRCAIMEDETPCHRMCREVSAATHARGQRSKRAQVIDCGGGIVDISSFHVVNLFPPKLDQIGKAVGGPWGSDRVDSQFEGYLKVRWYVSHLMAQGEGETAVGKPLRVVAACWYVRHNRGLFRHMLARRIL